MGRSSKPWVPAWVGIGSNLLDPERQVRAAFDQLDALPDTRLWLASSLYRNPPMGPVDQPDYVNAVAGLLSRLTPRQLLESLQTIEAAAGRQRCAAQRWGPRVLDLDLLTYGSQRIDEPGLTVPHPGIADRNFVLLPLLEVAPGLQVPGLAPIRQLASAVDGGQMQRID